MTTAISEKMRHLFIIQGPHLSEKASWLADKRGQFVFRVSPKAKKPEIKQAVEYLFSVNVSSVRVLNVKGKARVFKQIPGRRKNWKKAYVRLYPGQDIDFSVIK